MLNPTNSNTSITHFYAILLYPPPFCHCTALPPTMDAHIAGLADLFSATLQPDPQARKAAEAQISQAQRQPGFPQLLVRLIYNDANPAQQQQPQVRLAAAINFKNLCRTGWQDSEEHEALVSEQDKQQVRDQLLLPLLFHLYDSSSSSGSSGGAAVLQSQLAESVALIAEHDFPARWPTLLDELVSRLSLDTSNPGADQGALLGVLQVSHSIFRSWRSAMRTNDLYSTINLVLGKFADPFLRLLQQTDAALTSSESSLPPKTVQALAAALSLEIQLFYDLSAQDLPPQFEDNLDKHIAPIFLRWLSFSRPELAPPADEEDEEEGEAGELEKIRAGVCEVAELYAQRYLDVFGKHLGPTVQAVWQMLGGCGRSARFDALVSRAIGLLSTVVKMGNQRAMFDSPDTLRQFVEAIILPNVQMRQSDEELFEDNQIEYIRRDLDVTGGGSFPLT